MTEEQGEDQAGAHAGEVPRALAVSWDSMRRYGLALESVLLAALPPEELRRLRGPAVKRVNLRGERHPLNDPDEPVGVLLAPDLDPADPVVQLLANAAQWDHIRVFADEDLSQTLSPIPVTPWTPEIRPEGTMAQWGEGKEHGSAILSYGPRVPGAMGRIAMPGAPPGDELDRMDLAMTFARASRSPVHITATRKEAAIWTRATGSGAAEWGLCTPEEALGVALLLQAHHGRHLIQAGPGYISSANNFTWYSGLAQVALPAYLSVFSDEVTKWSSMPESEPRPQSADVLQGVHARVRQLLRTHDELAWIALTEGVDGSDNDMLQVQSELLFDAVSAVNATLDGLTVWLVARDPVPVPPQQAVFVGFRTLRAGQHPWTKGFTHYKTAVDLLRAPISPILGLTTDLRKVGYHYHPLLGTSLQVAQLVEVMDQSGQKDWRVAREVTAGAVRIPADQVQAYGLTYGVDGIIALDGDAFALPWGFVRAVLRDFIDLTAAVLEAIAVADGHTTHPKTELIDPESPYARFVLDFTAQLPIDGPAEG